jgi:hypothetical protein
MRRGTLRRKAFSPYLAEGLEARLLLAGLNQNVGLLAGRFFIQHTVTGSDTDVFTFTIPSNPGAPGGLTTIDHIDVQLSRPIGTGNMVLRSGNTVLAQTAKTSNDQQLSFDPGSTGPFTLSVRADQSQLFPAYAYTLEIVTDAAPAHSGTTFATVNAAPVGTGILSETSNSEINDFVGYFDTSAHAGRDLVDIYSFNVPAVGSLEVDLELSPQGDPAGPPDNVHADLSLYRDANGDGVLQPGETLAVVTAKDLGAPLAEVTSASLNPGQYFVAVTRLQPSVNNNIGGTNYSLDFVYHAKDNAGNTLAAAKSVSLTSTAQTFHDYLSSADPVDIYKFDALVAGPFTFDAKLTGVPSSDFDLQLVEDKNHNGQIDIGNGEIIDFSQNRGVHDEHISHLIAAPDTYFLLVKRFFGEDVYTLTMTNTSTDTVGNTLATATPLIGHGGSVSVASASELVGPIDTADIYKFTAHSGEYRIQVSPTNGSVAVDVINDANNNKQIDAGEAIATLSGASILNGVVAPPTGDVYFRVRPLVASNVNYSINITVSREAPFSGTPITINTMLPTKIEAEDFDNGGEGFGYLDTTVGNDNGAFRANEDVDIKTTADTDGGTDQSVNRFRVTDTVVGEFLNYTIKVSQAGNYNIDFRASSPAAGAACHIEIDGTDVTGPVAIPNTGGFDVMTTVTRPGVALTAGPHVMTLKFDSATSGGFAGAYNFIRLTPAASPGTFKLTPAQSTVAPGQSDKIAIKWTVPSGSWHQLDDIQLRLLSADGTRIKVRWNEAANTLSLYDNLTHKFGPAKKIGSNAILSNKYVHIHLATSSVKASGPTSPTVTLTIDLRFTAAASGKTFVLAASADDDLGHHAASVDAGSIVVT